MTGGAMPARPMSPRHVGLAAVAALLYAGCYAAIKEGLAFAPPMRFAALRALIGGAALLGIMVAARRPLMPSRRLWGPIVLLAIIGPALGFAAMFSSPLHTGAGLASVVGNTGPLLVIVLAALFLQEPLTAPKICALGVGMLGVTLIALPNAALGASGHVAALALPLVAAVSGASESVIVKRVQPGSEVLSVAAWQFLLAAPVLFVLSAWLEQGRSIAWTGTFALILAFLAGGSTALATGLWYWLVQQEEVSRLSLVLFLVPVAGFGLGAARFGERAVPIQGVGILLVLVGIAIAALTRARSAPFSRRSGSHQDRGASSR